MRKVFTVWDDQVKTYLDPFIALNKGEALRVMSDLVNNPQTTFGKYNQDFTLFEIADYDDEQGQYHMHKTKSKVAGLWELKKQEPITRINGPTDIDRRPAVN